MTLKQNIVPGSIRSAHTNSVARSFPTGITLASAGRPYLGTWAIQNLDAATEIRLWYGLVPIDPLDPEAGSLPEDPTGWDAGQTTSATTTISTYGEKIKAGEYLESFVPPNAQLYVYVSAGPVVCHEKEG